MVIKLDQRKIFTWSTTPLPWTKFFGTRDLFVVVNLLVVIAKVWVLVLLFPVLVLILPLILTYRLMQHLMTIVVFEFFICKIASLGCHSVSQAPGLLSTVIASPQQTWSQTSFAIQFQDNYLLDSDCFLCQQWDHCRQKRSFPDMPVPLGHLRQSGGSGAHCGNLCCGLWA